MKNIFFKNNNTIDEYLIFLNIFQFRIIPQLRKTDLMDSIKVA